MTPRIFSSMILVRYSIFSQPMSDNLVRLKTALAEHYEIKHERRRVKLPRVNPRLGQLTVAEATHVVLSRFTAALAERYGVIASVTTGYRPLTTGSTRPSMSSGGSIPKIAATVAGRSTVRAGSSWRPGAMSFPAKTSGTCES